MKLKEYVEGNLSKGFICSRLSPARSPVLFMKTGDRSLSLSVDYQGITKVTVKNRHPLPLIQQTLLRLSKAKRLTKLDLRGAYKPVRMAEGEEWKTVFRSHFGHFPYLVMPFGLTNTAVFFQHFMNDTLREYLEIFGTAYIEDILLYSYHLEEPRRQVRTILQV